MLFGKLLPREGNFFELFNQHGAYIVEGARAFMLMIQNSADSEPREKYADQVVNAERSADRVTAEVNRLLHKTFITPIDREQIHELVNAMDDICDIIQDVTESITLYDIPFSCQYGAPPTPEARRDYRGIELMGRKSFGEKLWLQASYVYSSLKGNWDGSVNQSSGQTMPGINSDFDYPQFWAQISDGKLFLDRTHRLRGRELDDAVQALRGPAGLLAVGRAPRQARLLHIPSIAPRSTSSRAARRATFRTSGRRA